MQRFLAVSFLIFLCSANAFSQKTWESRGVSITHLDTLGNGFEALRGAFTIENSSIYEVINLILDVDGYHWVEGESKSKMLSINKQDSTFIFDFFVDIPWLFVKRTGRVKVDIDFKEDIFYTKSTQINDYKRDESYEPIDFYYAQWKIQKHGLKDIKVDFLGVYQDQKMVFNINNIVIKKIRKRLNETLYNLKVLASEKTNPIKSLSWPMGQNNAKLRSSGNK
ncbi:hypothetical protein ACV07N_04320 [Roseivirga echinicomitans]